MSSSSNSVSTPHKSKVEGDSIGSKPIWYVCNILIKIIIKEFHNRTQSCLSECRDLKEKKHCYA